MSQQTQSAEGSVASKKRSHSMRFGTLVEPNNIVSFRLWAPNSQSVQLALFDGAQETRHAMNADGSGWHNLATQARPGMEYQFVLDDGLRVPDPASRFQPNDVHGRSQIVDPALFQWSDGDWHGRPWDETVLYEIHVGTFTEEGTFAGVANKLDYLKDLGVTAIELMPVADFPGKYGWGYDGVLPYAPESRYGSPNDFKSLIQQAHQRGMQVFLDVVYNHFGPEGNYLHAYAKEFFTDKHKTPWGSALNFEGRQEVREFFIENALYWLNEFNMDGLRLDAVHAIKDDSGRHVLIELANRVAEGPGRERPRHLVLENEDNGARFLERDHENKPKIYTAQWNDDIHHAYHVVATGESGGYYADYVKSQNGKNTVALLGRALAEGFIYQDEPSEFRDGEIRGEKSDHLPPSSFVSFLQNHDQVGNRAFGDRIASISDPKILNALSSIQLLAPSVPLLFMGEEWGCKTSFLYFCDLGSELAPLVTEGRRSEFAKFPEFLDPKTRHSIPDPCKLETFEQSKLDWSDLENALYLDNFKVTKALLALRIKEIVPLLSKIDSGKAALNGELLTVEWSENSKPILLLLANLTKETHTMTDNKFKQNSKFKVVYKTKGTTDQEIEDGTMPPHSVLWLTVK
jgi:malto-oligosyltrehalose trehalohydrolase